MSEDRRFIDPGPGDLIKDEVLVPAKDKLEQHHWWEILAQKASQKPSFVGYYLKLFLHSLPQEAFRPDLAAVLGVDSDTLNHIYVCTVTPRMEQGYFREDCGRIYEKYKCDPDALEFFLRQGLAIARQEHAWMVFDKSQLVELYAAMHERVAFLRRAKSVTEDDRARCEGLLRLLLEQLRRLRE
jgi:hypothetical protein